MKTLSILFTVALIVGGLATSSTHPKLPVSSVLNVGKAVKYVGFKVGEDH